MRGLGKKPAMVADMAFDRMVSQVSKAALIDALWCACQLGTDETPEQITTRGARELEAALRLRDDRIPSDIATTAKRRIDSDPPA